MLKQYYTEIRSLRIKSDNIACDCVLKIGTDIFKYDKNSSEFMYLSPFFVSFLSRINRYMTASHHTISKKKINHNIFAINAEYEHWKLIVEQLEQRCKMG